MERDTRAATRILLAEDSDRDAELVLYELKRAGVRFESRRVQTEADFHRALDEFRPQLILSDFVMPGFGGVAALRICREAGIDIPFIFVSGTIGEDVAVEAMKAGADDYVMKTNLIRLGPTVVRALREAGLRQGGRVTEAALLRAQTMAKLAHVITGPDGSFESWSDTLPQMIGLEPAAMPRSTREWLNLVHPDDRASLRAKAIEAARTGVRIEFEYRLRRADGYWLNISQTTEALLGASAAPGKQRWFGTMQDVTEQKRTAQNLRDSEGLKGAILEASLDCIVTIDNAGIVVEFNPAAEATFGFTREQALGKPMAELIIPPRVREAHHLGIARFLVTGEGPILGKRVQLEAMRADGTEFPVELTVVAIRSGPRPLFTGFIRDLTESRLAEEEQLAYQERLRESEARFRSLSQLSSDWFWRQDEDFRFTEFTGDDSSRDWGPDEESSLGKRRWELPGVTPLSGSWDEHKALHEAHLPFRNFEYQHARTDGTTTYISASGEPVFDAEGR